MTDYQKLKELLTSFGVEFEEETWRQTNELLIRTEQGMSKVDGYGGFCTIFVFDEEGTFKSMGAWE